LRVRPIKRTTRELPHRFDGEPLRILYCIPTLWQGGAERQLSYLAATLAEMGHEIHVASLRDGHNLDRLRAAGVVWHQLGGFSNHDPLILLRLIGLIRKLKPDVVQTSLAQMDILGGLASLLTHTKWVLRESSSAPLYCKGWKNRLRFALGKRADAIVSNSVGGETYWRTTPGTRKLYMISNALPLDEILQARACQVAGIMSGRAEKMVLYAGRMDAGKNVESLIVALARIADELPFVAVLCGDGPLRPCLERMAQELGIARRLIFTGYITNLWALMKRADVFVSLSEFEGCPNAVLEAMASGCPLVVSDILAHREILDEGTACLVSPLDPAAVAAAIKAVLKFDSAALNRAAAARTKIEEWTVEKMAKLYERLYLNLLDNA
jgi:glycosyltransferase involved in cell wall biosynthesis